MTLMYIAIISTQMLKAKLMIMRTEALTCASIKLLLRLKQCACIYMYVCMYVCERVCVCSKPNTTQN